MCKLLENKIALITGGGTGIGKATAILFGNQGAKVIIANRRIEKGEEISNIIASEGGEALCIPTDVSKAEQVKILFDRIINKYGRLDCAFNCAGFDGERKHLLDMSENEWDEIVNINLKGTFLLLKHEIEVMSKLKKGIIVNMGSVSGLFGRAGRSAYNASRSAIMNLTKTVANEYIKKGIRINAVAPGAVDTDIFQRMIAGNKKKRKQYENAHPIGRIAQPREIAEAVLWLCSEKSSFVVGHTLVVDGGASIAGGAQSS